MRDSLMISEVYYTIDVIPESQITVELSCLIKVYIKC